MGLLPRKRDAHLHPAQCRTNSAAPAFRTQQPPACGARLDTAGQHAALPSPHALDIAFTAQSKILGLLHPHGPATTESLGHQVAAASYLTDLRIVAGLISASWPAALDTAPHPPLTPQLDEYLKDRHHRINLRRQHKTRPPAIVLHDQPPVPADACAALLVMADHMLTSDDHDAARRTIRSLADRAPLGPPWQRRVTAIHDHLSPGLQVALQPTLARWTKPKAGTPGHRFTPTRRANFDHRHIPQRLPDSQYDRHFGHLPGGNPTFLRRLAALRLVHMVEGGSYAHACTLLGVPFTLSQSAVIQLGDWFRDASNSVAFTAALNTLADELDQTSNLIDYGMRRQHLSRWLIPPSDCQVLSGGRANTPPLRQGMTNWGDRKRRFASWIVWTTVTSSEPHFAPTTILPAVYDKANAMIRRGLGAEWHALHQRPYRHHAELRQRLDAYTTQLTRGIDNGGLHPGRPIIDHHHMTAETDTNPAR